MTKMIERTPQSPLVTIACLSYNHEKYIARAIESFIEQETDFPYQIIVFDDLSTDKTSSIIKKYADAYPQFITFIQPQSNLFSQGKSWRKYIYPMIQGEYVALCEGDDWFSSKNKIKIQLEYMLSHRECSACCHAVTLFDTQTGSFFGEIAPYKTVHTISCAEAIEHDGGLIGTNSLFMKKALFILPELYSEWPVGDYPTNIYLAESGNFDYLPQTLSCYRTNVPTSWTSRIRQDAQNNINHTKSLIAKLEEYDIKTNHAYHASVQKRINTCLNDLLILNRSFKLLNDQKIARAFNSLSFIEKIKLHLIIYFPNCFEIYKTLIRKKKRRKYEREHS